MLHAWQGALLKAMHPLLTWPGERVTPGGVHASISLQPSMSLQAFLCPTHCALLSTAPHDLTTDAALPPMPPLPTSLHAHRTSSSQRSRCPTTTRPPDCSALRCQSPKTPSSPSTAAAARGRTGGTSFCSSGGTWASSGSRTTGEQSSKSLGCRGCNLWRHDSSKLAWPVGGSASRLEASARAETGRMQIFPKVLCQHPRTCPCHTPDDAAMACAQPRHPPTPVQPVR